MTSTVAGVDGCRGGWLCVLRRTAAPLQERAFVARTFLEVLAGCAEAAVIAIDIPIGLPAQIAGGGRDCDRALRKALGPRASTVFLPPARAALAETEYRRACAAALAASAPPRQISKQMFHLLPKMREIDSAMTPEAQTRVFECHPEGAFWIMNGGAPLIAPKKLKGRPHAPGLAARRALLADQGFSDGFLSAAHFRPGDAGADDFLDACACSWTASRILRGEAVRFPASPPVDPKGLRMEILA